MSVESRLNAAKEEVENLKNEISELRESKNNVLMKDVVNGVNLTAIKKPPAMKMRRMLKGHFGKVYALHWAGDSTNLVSASQDGKLIVWNGMSTNKVSAISLRSSWVMTCAFEPTQCELVACGGLDNICSVYNVHQTLTRPGTELVAHDGYLSCCRFIDQEKIITTSGDSSCILWDIQNAEVVKTFLDHRGDVMSVSICPTNPNVFVTGSIDTTAKIWDVRAGKCVQTHFGHESDINSVAFFPDGNAFGTGSDDSSCRIFDMRSYSEVNCLQNNKILCGVTSIAFSRSGRLLFGGYDDSNVFAWDILSDGKAPAYQLDKAHENRVSCIGLNPSGDALATGSWDTQLKIWA